MKEGMCSRRDLEAWYSIDDVREDNLVLDEYHDAERRYWDAERARRPG